MARSDRKPRPAGRKTRSAGRSRSADRPGQTVAIGILVEHLEQIVSQLNVVLKAARQVQSGGVGLHLPGNMPSVLVGRLCQDVAQGPDLGDPARRRR
jgi:hypothetical protein